MKVKFQAIKGMNDFLPSHTGLWQKLETVIRDLTKMYGYSEIRTPIVEKTSLFKRSIGEVTDIVEKEMYTWKDISDESLTLRPECTASTVRAGNEHGLLYNQQQKLWYMGPMFRREKPQKDRYRQFHQFGMEAFGFAGPDVDVELILFTARLWKMLGIDASTQLHINSLGQPESRKAYRELLVAYFKEHEALLDEDSQRRLLTNPMRILDSKNPNMQEMIENAPKLMEHLDDESKLHFEQLCEKLDAVGIEYVIDQRLVRGLDYYNRTVFEWITNDLGAQGTICGGGRYDGLVEQLGGQATTACGFAMGLERILSLVANQPFAKEVDNAPHVYCLSSSGVAENKMLQISETLRTQFPKLRLTNHCGGGNFKKQVKKADKSGARIALILGEDEVNQDTIAIKFLRESKEQQVIAQSNLHDIIQAEINF